VCIYIYIYRYTFNCRVFYEYVGLIKTKIRYRFGAPRTELFRFELGIRRIRRHRILLGETIYTRLALVFFWAKHRVPSKRLTAGSRRRGRRSFEKLRTVSTNGPHGRRYVLRYRLGVIVVRPKSLGSRSVQRPGRGHRFPYERNGKPRGAQFTRPTQYGRTLAGRYIA